MSVSLPSKEIYTVDVPEVKNFTHREYYNFFVPDEQVNEISGVPKRLLNRKSADEDAEYTQYLETRVPRYVKFSWNNVNLSDPGGFVHENMIRENAMRPSKRPPIITMNLDKIVDEDHFSSYNYISVMYHDGEIDQKVYSFVSGSYEQLTLDEPKESHVSPHKAAAYAQEKMPSRIHPQFAQRAMTNHKIAYNAEHYNTGDNGNDKTAANKKAVQSPYFERLKTVFLHSQINAKLFNDVTNRNIKNPNSPFALDLHSLQKVSRKVSSSTQQRMGQTISESEFKVVVPYVNLRVDRTSHHQQHRGAEIVGYIIDKYEVSQDGTLKKLQPLIVEHPNRYEAIDVRVKYNQQYMYTIRTIALFNLPAIDVDTNDVATIQILVSSKPSNKIYAKIFDNVAPPVPSDINFTWNYETNKLLIHWTFPPNSQRDIKKFQVFRRKSIDYPFELLKEYDFDDSAVRIDDHEHADARLVEHLISPTTFYTDDDFTKSTEFIYTVCAIDAHGLTSNYGAQYLLGFDIFKNQLTKRLISHSGAPKPYPNLYLEGEGFVNVARVSGAHSKRMRLFFAPQCYMLEDDQGRIQRVLSTNQTRGSYKFQFINTDNQKMDTLTVKIDDRIQPVQPKVAFPKFMFTVPKIAHK